MVFPATDYRSATDLAIDASNQLHRIINEDATSTIATESGSVDSLRKILSDNFKFKQPVDWVESEFETVFNQLRQFADGTWWYSPVATSTNQVVMGINPYEDSNWVLFTPTAGFVTIEDVTKFSSVYKVPNVVYHLVQYSPDTLEGGRHLIYNSTLDKSFHNGKTVFSPTVPFTTVQNYENGIGEIDPLGIGCFEYLDFSIITLNIESKSSGRVINLDDIVDTVEYSIGVVINSYNTLVKDGEDFYNLMSSETLPYTTTGTGMPEGGAFQAVGDVKLRWDLAAGTADIGGQSAKNVADLRGDLANSGGSSLVANNIIVFDSVADMEAATWLSVGKKSITLGYYTPGDGGANDYVIEAGGSGVPDGGSRIDLPGSGLQAKALFSMGYLHVSQFGASGFDDYQAIQNALNFASISKFKRVVADGVHPVSAQLRTYSRVIIDMGGSGEIRREFNTSPTGAGLFGINLLPGELRSYDVRILNGWLNGNGVNFTQSFNIFGGGNVDCLYIENVKFTDVVDFHAVDFNGTTKLRVKSCQFLGFANTSGTRGFSEAIQCDPGYVAPDAGRTNQDWIIEDCDFGPNPDNVDINFGAWPTGFGNHSANNLDSIAEDFHVINCRFNGCTFSAISPMAWSDCSFTGNSFNDCAKALFLQPGSGTNLRGCYGIKFNKNFISGSTVTDRAIHAAASTVNPENFFHRDISIKDNLIDGTLGSAILMQYVDGFTLFSNDYKDIGTSSISMSNCYRGDIGGGTMINVSQTAILLTESIRDLCIHSVVANDLKGRFVHGTGTLAELRRSITVSQNILTDVARTCVAFDGGASSKIQINNNVVSKGILGVEPSDALIFNLGVTGGSNYLRDNCIDDVILQSPGKTFRATDGGLLTGECYGSPEGVVIAGVGSVIRRKDGAVGTTFYVKESGTGNTGWVAK